MQIKKFVIVLICVLSFKMLNAQQLTWAIPKKIKGRIIYSTILGAGKGKYFLLKYDKKSKQSFIIEKYNSELRSINHYEFRIEKDISISKVMYLNNKIFIFYSFLNKNNNKYELYVDILKDNLTKYSEENHLLSSEIRMPGEKLFIIKKDKYTDRFVVVSPDIFSKEEIRYKFTIFDSRLRVHFKNILVFNYQKGFKLEQIYLADSSIITITKTTAFEKPRKKKSFYTFREFDFARNNKNEYKLYYDSIIINNGIFKYDIINNTFLFIGLYSQIRSHGHQGLSFLKIFKDNDSAVVHFIPFNRQLINSLMGKKVNSPGLMNFYPRKVILRNDGGFIFLCEYFDVQQEVYQSDYNFNHPNTNYIRYYYQYKDIFIVSVNPNGKIDWTKIIRKDQVSINDDEGYYSSFLAGALSEKLVFLYNELGVNSSDLIYYQIDPNGKVKHNVLVDRNTFDGYLIPKIGYQVSNNEIIMPGYNRKRGFLLLKISFD